MSVLVEREGEGEGSRRDELIEEAPRRKPRHAFAGEVWTKADRAAEAAARAIHHGFDPHRVAMLAAPTRLV